MLARIAPRREHSLGIFTSKICQLVQRKIPSQNDYITLDYDGANRSAQLNAPKPYDWYSLHSIAPTYWKRIER